MVHFDTYREQMDALSETSHANTNENKASTEAPKNAQHPQPWCGQHLATDNANNKNIYSYSSINNKEKSPMWRIAELARYHKLKHEYALLDESGPAHKKLFTVRLVLTENQCFEGSGASIKKAQQAAAAVAIKETTLSFPPEKTFRRKKEATPPELLSFFARKLDLPDPIYRPHMQPKPPRTRIQGPFVSKSMPKPPFYPSPYSDMPATGFGQRGMVPCIPTSHPPPPIMSHPPPSTRIQPGLISSNVPSCVPVYPFDSQERVCLISVSIGPGQVFTGAGQNYYQAKSNAAAQALCYLGPAIVKLDSKLKGEQQSSNEPFAIEDLNKTIAKMTVEEPSSPPSDSEEPIGKNKQKSVVSTVHECAHQMKLDVEIEVITEDGPPHERNYVVRCALRNVIVENLGEGRKKKIATQQACLGVLDKLRELENSPIYMASCLFKAQKRTKPVSKESKRKTIVKDMKMDPSYGHQINPVTRLGQILHARSEPDPVYTVVGEHGQSRYKEFIVEARCMDTFCTGTGPNKRLAKRAAAEEMLAKLGFVKPLPAPGKGLLKKKLRLSPIGIFDPNEVNEPQSCPEDQVKAIEEEVIQMEESRSPVTEEETPTQSEPSSGHVSPSMTNTSRCLQRRVTFSNQVKACPPPDDANYPQPEVAPLKVDVVVEGRLKRMRKSKDGKRCLNDVEKAELTELATSFLSEYCATYPNAFPMSTEATAGKDSIHISREKLDFFADKFKFSVQYTNFPKSPDGCEQYYFALVTLGLDKPVVCHGSGLTDEGAAENGAYNAICRLAKLGEDESSTSNVANS
ncbi:unnamed protein product [Auanema sp. JU1783]|nr:unnamed protein product [Auanema sp. JU1783]